MGFDNSDLQLPGKKIYQVNQQAKASEVPK